MEQGDGKGTVRCSITTLDGSHGYRYFHKLVLEAEGRGAVLRRKATRWQVGTSPNGQPRERQPREEMKSEQMECESVLAM